MQWKTFKALFRSSIQNSRSSGLWVAWFIFEIRSHPKEFRLNGNHSDRRDNRMTDLHCLAILEPMLSSGTFLTFLDLSFNELGNASAVLIAQYLHVILKVLRKGWKILEIIKLEIESNY